MGTWEVPTHVGGLSSPSAWYRTCTCLLYLNLTFTGSTIVVICPLTTIAQEATKSSTKESMNSSCIRHILTGGDGRFSKGIGWKQTCPACWRCLLPVNHVLPTNRECGLPKVVQHLVIGRLEQPEVSYQFEYEYNTSVTIRNLSRP